MTHNDAPIMHRCVLCKYQTKRKFDLKRHHNAIHMRSVCQNIENVNNEKNVTPNEKNVTPNEKNVTFDKLICLKCNKIYKTKNSLLSHVTKCKGIDDLTCPRCMISFKKRQHKYRHIQANKCKARSIVHSRPPNIQNVTNNIHNIEKQVINYNDNRIYINNFGSERIDHITEEDLKRILQSGINTVPLYIEKKHFDSNFPENKNIKYTNDNKCQVMEGNSWKEKDIGLLSNNLIKNNSEVLLMYCDSNEVKLMNEIKDEDIYDHIRNKLLIIYNKSDDQKYNNIMLKIKDMIKSSGD